MISVLKLFVVNNVLKLVALPLSVSGIGQGVLLSDEHGDWEVDLRQIKLWNSSLPIHLLVHGASVVELLKYS